MIRLSVIVSPTDNIDNEIQHDSSSSLAGPSNTVDRLPFRVFFQSETNSELEFRKQHAAVTHRRRRCIAQTYLATNRERELSWQSLSHSRFFDGLNPNISGPALGVQLFREKENLKWFLTCEINQECAIYLRCFAWIARSLEKSVRSKSSTIRPGPNYLR